MLTDILGQKTLKNRLILTLQTTQLTQKILTIPWILVRQILEKIQRSQSILAIVIATTVFTTKYAVTRE